jgi:hypothetical protein
MLQHQERVAFLLFSSFAFFEQIFAFSFFEQNAADFSKKGTILKLKKIKFYFS